VQGLKIFNTDDLCEDTYDGSKWMKHCSQLIEGDSIRPADIWTELNAIPNGVERYGMFSFSFGNKIITGLGLNEVTPFYLVDIWEYDVITKIWTQKNNFPGTGRNAVFSCVVNGKGYIIGGSNSSGDQVWEYLFENDSWTQKSNFPEGQRRYLTGFVLNNEIYLGTGDGADYENDFWKYNPTTDTWTPLPDVPGPGRNFATGFAIGNKGYIGMGRSDPSTSLNDIYEFDPVDNSWEIKQIFPNGGGGPLTRFVIKDTAYVGLGTFDNNLLPLMYKFDPLASPTEQWSPLNDFPSTPRTTAFVSVINNKAFLGCGYVVNGDYLNDFWVYNPFPDSLHNYKEQTPSNINNMTNHDWSSENTTKLFATNTKYKVGIGTKTPKVKLHVEGNNDAGLGDNSGLLLVGNIDGGNIVMDNNEIIARDNGVVSPLYLQKASGSLLDIGGDVDIAENVVIGGKVDISGNIGIGTIASTSVPVWIQGGSNAGLSSTAGYLVIGPTSGANVVFDNNEIQARSFGGPSNLVLQKEGGNLTIAADTVVIGGGQRYQRFNVYGHAYKSTGSTTWTNTSDRRLKEDIVKYDDGLTEILKIEPVWFRYTKESGCDYTQKYVGVIAQDLQKITPYMISHTTKNAPDGSPYLQLDNSAMTYMLINAVKEQQMMIDELKEMNLLLKSTKDTEISQLKADIDAIKQLLKAQILAKN
jgi:N-acetylneuraminic acid mutarotase